MHAHTQVCRTQAAQGFDRLRSHLERLKVVKVPRGGQGVGNGEEDRDPRPKLGLKALAPESHVTRIDDMPEIAALDALSFHTSNPFTMQTLRVAGAISLRGPCSQTTRGRQATLRVRAGTLWSLAPRQPSGKQAIDLTGAIGSRRCVGRVAYGWSEPQ